MGEVESIGASPDGRWQEVKDKNGNRTGTRVDGGHPGTHDDPRAQGPHGHGEVGRGQVSFTKCAVMKV